MKRYDKNGMELELLDWARLFEQDAYRQVELTELPSGYQVSTIWEGFDPRALAADGLARTPDIFETVAFFGERRVDEERAPTHREALTTHARFVERYTDARPPESPEDDT